MKKEKEKESEIIDWDEKFEELFREFGVKVDREPGPTTISMVPREYADKLLIGSKRKKDATNEK